MSGTIYRKNCFLEFLKKFNLINNKHIPLQYKTSSIDDRLNLLAGLIDSDGYYQRGCYEIVQKRKKLSEDIVDLCRSLGFGTTIKKVRKTCTNAKNGPKTGTYYLVRFSGHAIKKIPVLLKRKKASTRKMNKKTWVTGFDIRECGIGHYCGFELDGNGRFLLGTHMVAHNGTIQIKDNT